mmetsp:Transcript_58804/g.136849  ORF Transcript_58804/g.136849 Transcript_58804/m.136849 type:complete len:198 (-) Transcript_58804:96-689(-)
MATNSSRCWQRRQRAAASTLLLLAAAASTRLAPTYCLGSGAQVSSTDGARVQSRRVLLGTGAALSSAAPAWATNAKDKEWLAAKAAEPGVVTLPSGLMYKVLEEGPAGGPSPGLATKCSCTYAGQLTNGRQFDAGTLDFAPKQVIKGWTEAMQLMKEGDKWELYIPSELAYGERGAGGRIPGGAALQFQMKINKVKR